MTVATFNDRLYGVPLYADVSALFYNKDLFEKAGLDPEQAADEPRRAPRVRRQDHGARRRHQGLLPARQLRGLQHLHRRPADVGLGREDRGRQVRRRAAASATASSTCSSSRATWSRPATCHESARAENGDTFHLQFGSGKVGMMGTGNFNITLARDQMKDPDMKFGISLLPGVEPGSSASFIGGDLVVVPNGSEARRRRRRRS